MFILSVCNVTLILLNPLYLISSLLVTYSRIHYLLSPSRRLLLHACLTHHFLALHRSSDAGRSSLPPLPPLIFILLPFYLFRPIPCSPPARIFFLLSLLPLSVFLRSAASLMQCSHIIDSGPKLRGENYQYLTSTHLQTLPLAPHQTCVLISPLFSNLT